MPHKCPVSFFSLPSPSCPFSLPCKGHICCPFQLPGERHILVRPVLRGCALPGGLGDSREGSWSGHAQQGPGRVLPGDDEKAPHPPHRNAGPLRRPLLRWALACLGTFHSGCAFQSAAGCRGGALQTDPITRSPKTRRNLPPIRPGALDVLLRSAIFFFGGAGSAGSEPVAFPGRLTPRPTIPGISVSRALSLAGSPRSAVGRGAS